jgi:predicted MFS family arabinose efflux permease
VNPDPPFAAPIASRPGAYAWYVMALLVATTSFNVADRNLMNILIPPIQKEFGASDTAMGLLVGMGFALVHIATILPVAYWADRGPRNLIISGGLFLWSGLTALSGIAQSYWQIAAARMGVAAAESTGSAPVHSLLSDYFPLSHRATAMGLISIGGTLGIGIGLAVGGAVAQDYGWRQAFFVFGLPGVIFSLLLFATVREPARGGSDGRPSAPPSASLGETLRYLTARRAFVHIVLASCFHCFASIGSSTWYPTYLYRVHGLDLKPLGLSYALAGPLASALGALVAGRISDRLSARDLRWSMWIPAIGATCAFPFTLAFILWPAGPSFELRGMHLPDAMLFMVPGSFLMGFWSGPSLSMVLSIAKPQMRALASALTTGSYNLVGMGLGPLLVGTLSDALSADHGVDAIRYALLVVTGAHVIATVHNLLAIRPLRGDVAAGRS